MFKGYYVSYAQSKLKIIIYDRDGKYFILKKEHKTFLPISQIHGLYWLGFLAASHAEPPALPSKNAQF